jgi:phospholipid/cholesterol/gamma-HCH transport system substrate-binding protein
MATEARKFRVGVFVITAVLILVGGVIWLGASRFFERSLYLVTYFSESVQGLEPGAAVKYRGVPSGRVEEIRVAPDGDLIEVVMSMDVNIAQSVKEDETLRAQLQLTGITGLRYVEINRHSGEALNRFPALTFEPPYPVIRSTPSSFIAVQDALEDLYKRFSSIDFGGISGDIRSTLQAADVLLRDPNLQTMLANFQETSESTVRLSKNLERMTRKIDLDPALENLTRATEEARALFADLRAGETGTQLRETLRQVDRLALSAQHFVISLQQTTEQLDRTVDNLERVTEEVRLQPSRLLFSEPPPERHPGDGRSR